MSHVAVFLDEMFGEIRIVDSDGEPWFIAKDVASTLGYSNTTYAIRTHCKGAQEIRLPSSGGMQITKIISEDDLYRLVSASRLPTAEKFKDWVFGVVLPEIRKKGSYVEKIERPFSEREMCERYLQSLIREEEYQRKIEEDAPKVEFYDTVTASETVCDLAIACQVAKLPFGKNTLFRMLREDGVLISSRTRWNLPKQEYINRKYFTVSESTYKHPKTGEQEVSFKTQCTQKGIEWLMKRYGVLGTQQEVQQNRIGFRAD